MIPTAFANPWWLTALVLPAALALSEWFRRRHALVVPFDHSGARSGVWLGRLLRTAALLPSLLLAIAIVLLARPIRPDLPTEERVLTNIEFVIDVSGSMMSEFGNGTRFEGSLSAIEAFTNHRQGDAFGLTIFGNEVLHWTPLTKDLAAIRTAAPFVRPGNMPAQFNGTEIGKALRASLKQVRLRGQSDGLMVLVSDGESADLYDNEARRVGTELATAGIVLYAIHVGDDEVPTDLYELTGPSRGQVFAAQNPGALPAIFAHIDRLQPVRMRPVAAHPVDTCSLPALIGLALTGLFVGSSFLLRYTPW
ncbi:VWA domain-containing protein [Anatilimnocola sp. NA78]|uniref:vWA domain-containing protein n=1 Tax=Anatilimnocola sp. NA78 TaxID=3415683 RepID=UPI003CE5AC99